MQYTALHDVTGDNNKKACDIDSMLLYYYSDLRIVPTHKLGRFRCSQIISQFIKKDAAVATRHIHEYMSLKRKSAKAKETLEQKLKQR